jgi:hypothetical protein
MVMPADPRQRFSVDAIMGRRFQPLPSQIMSPPQVLASLWQMLMGGFVPVPRSDLSGLQQAVSGLLEAAAPTGRPGYGGVIAQSLGIPMSPGGIPSLSAGGSSPQRAQLEPVAREIARRYGIPEDLFVSLITIESGWRPDAISPAGAIGLGQLMPATARDLGVDPWDPLQNLEGAARYLHQLYRMFGDWRLAAAAYNAGPKRVQEWLQGVSPLPGETQKYLQLLFGG